MLTPAEAKILIKAPQKKVDYCKSNVRINMAIKIRTCFVLALLLSMGKIGKFLSYLVVLFNR